MGKTNDAAALIDEQVESSPETALPATSEDGSSQEFEYPEPKDDDSFSIKIDFRKVVISAFILWQIYAVAVWLMPLDPGGPRQLLVPPLNDYVLGTGDWQQWTMFSPSPAREDSYVEARIDYADGGHRSWNIPRDSEMGYVERYQRERFRKMLESASTDDSKRMWPFIARYAAIVNSRTSPAAYPMTVHLVRHFRIIAPPPYPTPKFQAATFYTQKFDASPLPAPVNSQ